MRLVLTRTAQMPVVDPQQTEGELYVIQNGKIIYQCVTLELPWRNNARRVSCVPDGTYKCVKRTSPKYGHHWHLLNVPNRDLILIHSGNYNHHTLGCILVGKSFRDINKDGLEDVTDSVRTMNELRALLPDSFEIDVIWRE